MKELTTQLLPELRRDLICLRAGHELTIVLPFEGVQKSFDVDEPVFALLPLLDGSRAVDDAAEQLGVTSYWLTEIVGVFEEEDLIEPRLDLTALPPEARERFDRQIRFLARLPGVARTPAGAGVALERIRTARVVVIGAGSTGATVAAAVARAGVQRLRVIDPDRVELANLALQPVYQLADVGRPKVEALAAAIGLADPDVVVEPVIEQVTSGASLAAHVPDDASIVVVCADAPSTSILAGWVSDHCLGAGIAHLVGGGYAGAAGSLGLLVIPGQTACWRCFTATSTSPLADPAQHTVRGLLGGAGGCGPVAGAVANVLAYEVVRYLATGSSALAGHVSELRFDPLDIAQVDVDRRTGCACQHAPLAPLASLATGAAS